jgi:hypothetical protein
MSFPSRCLCFEIQDEFFSPAVLIGRKKELENISQIVKMMKTNLHQD